MTPPPPKAAGAKPRRSDQKGAGTGLMIMVPQETLQALRVKAAQEGSTVRALVLEALRAAKFPVPAAEMKDRRRKA